MSAKLIGQTLLNQYRVDEFIAAGGMGAVYRVWDLKRNVPLAMKVLHTDISEEPSAAKRFQREANALKELAHPNIVPFYGLFQATDFFFLLTAFVDGPCLKDLLTRRHGLSFSPIEALTFLKALSAALGYAHVNGFVHCDVKPGNVLLDQAGNIFLTDFGIARTTFGATTSTLSSAGTPAYMAPEQIRSEPLTPAADIYALGVMVFELLTGQRPFRGDEAETESAGRSTGERIIYAHLNLPAPDPRQLNPSIPPLLAQAVLQALQKDPAKRFANARAFFTACAAAIGLSPTAVPDRHALSSAESAAAERTLAATPDSLPAQQELPPRPTGAIEKPASHRPAWLIPTIGAGLLIVIVCLVAGLGYILSRRPSLTPAISTSAVLAATAAQTIEPTRPPPTDESTNPIIPSSPSPLPAISPTLSLDWRQGRLVFVNQVNNSRVLSIMDLSSGSEPEVLVTPPDRQNFMGPVFSPTDNRIAFYNQTTKEIFLIEALPDSQLVDLANGTQPTWSPDGSMILYRAGTGSFVIRDSSTKQQVGKMEVDPNANLPDWSPVGDMIAYAINADNGSTSIWKQPISGGGSSLLNDRSFQNYAPVWSHDGEWIAYQSDKRSGKSEIWVMDRNGNNAQRLTETPGDAWSRGPTWSPDDKWVAYVSSQAGSIGNDYGEVFVVPASGGDPIQITFTGGNVYDWRVDWGN
jgi:serine/threonine protein kinase